MSCDLASLTILNFNFTHLLLIHTLVKELLKDSIFTFCV